MRNIKHEKRFANDWIKTCYLLGRVQTTNISKILIYIKKNLGHTFNNIFKKNKEKELPLVMIAGFTPQKKFTLSFPGYTVRYFVIWKV